MVMIMWLVLYTVAWERDVKDNELLQVGHENKLNSVILVFSVKS